MKNGAGFSRRSFLKTILWGGLALPFLTYCQTKAKDWLVQITGTNHVLGHRLWAKNFPAPTETLQTSVLIMGGGISGLSAARYLKQNGQDDFLIFDLESTIGGNSRYGENHFSKYPMGAHYLPIPNREDKELIAFLFENGMYKGDDENGKPIFDDYQLVFPKDERYFFKNRWVSDFPQVDLVSESAAVELKSFQKLVHTYKTMRDDDGKYWFTIPIVAASTCDEVKLLESMTFKKWLSDNDFKSEELLWYLNYACKDDYGLGIDYVSAWAGLHYFCARKNNWASEGDDRVFTWPEGNGRLVEYLKKHSEGKIHVKHLVYDVLLKENHKVEVLVYDAERNRSKRIICDKVICAGPQFVNSFLFKGRSENNLNYVPWLLATLTLRPEFGVNEELAWDNVIYGKDGLGYIYDQHQNLGQNIGPKVITYYRSFSGSNVKTERRILLAMSEKELLNLVLEDLKVAHPMIEDYILDVEFNKIGHAMIAPIPNFIFSESLQDLRKPIDNRIFFAHSDLSGISIFEEAFHQGISAAKQVLS